VLNLEKFRMDVRLLFDLQMHAATSGRVEVPADQLFPSNSRVVFPVTVANPKHRPIRCYYFTHPASMKTLLLP
jgi:hypothetical protein